MTTLDTLARSSATAVHASVADVITPAAGIAGAAKAAAVWRTTTYAIGGAAAGVAVLFALLLAAPTLEPADSVVPTTNLVVPTTVPQPPITPTTPVPLEEEPPPVAVVPSSGGDEAQAPTTDVEPPALSVTSPGNGERLDTAVVTFSGLTEPGASVVASGKFLAVVAQDGAWAVDLVLAPGANGVRFVATDQAGNTSEVRLTVYLDTVEETTTTVAGWTFTANQKYGSCSEPVPYDVFTGQAEPNTVVTVSSPHGGGSTTADEKGQWSLQVEFPSALYNESFTVTVKDHLGSKKTFSFVSLYEG